MIVLDASALLAYLFREEGHEAVASVLEDSCISSVNLSEVIGRFVRDGHDAREVLGRVSSGPVEVVPFSAEDAAVAASLLPKTSKLGLSLGDRACLALATSRGVAAATADRSWRRLRLGVRLILIR
jgi:PIN domain nuclease of toxin-antitoxin system